MARSLNAGLICLNGEQDGQLINAVITGSYYRIRREKAPEFIQKFDALFKQLSEEDRLAKSGGESKKTVEYGCTIAFYPKVEADPDDPEGENQ